MAWTDKQKSENATRFMGGSNRPMGAANTDYAKQIAASISAFDKYHAARNAANSAAGSSGSAAATSTVTAPTASTQSSFDSGANWYNEALAAQQRARQRAYDAAAAAQRQQYQNSVNQVNAAADKALQDSYINRMQSQRTMNQGLTAQGLQGGASETALASLLNSYENSRNSTENARADNLSNLETTYLNNMASLRGILSSGQAGDISQYMTNIASLASQNGVNPITLYQQGGGDTSSAQSYYEWLQNYLASKGLNTTA